MATSRVYYHILFPALVKYQDVSVALNPAVLTEEERLMTLCILQVVKLLYEWTIAIFAFFGLAGYFCLGLMFPKNEHSNVLFWAWVLLWTFLVIGALMGMSRRKDICEKLIVKIG